MTDDLTEQDASASYSLGKKQVKLKVAWLDQQAEVRLHVSGLIRQQDN